MKQNLWFDVGHGYSVSFGQARARRGVRQAPRFILLGPAKQPNRLRPTIAAGAFVRGNVVVDHGALGPGFAARICELYDVWRGPRRPYTPPLILETTTEVEP